MNGIEELKNHMIKADYICNEENRYREYLAEALQKPVLVEGAGRGR